ncbi:fumarate hydratase [Hoeflea sp. WL0058]|uniref:Fumarate hydratase n=1 Tax=Flavimaribacter sediminis TaxID=2865987 RepID=A0AAE3D072_9HYPH|nr:fumarate hydratase [Flavimaribacter sediminis]MBW8638165.1 fumarate hydratase [Flavimaribacter sediminis]
MPVTYEMMKSTTRDLYEWSLKKIPEDSKVALRSALDAETEDAPKKALGFMLRSAERAETEDTLLCSDSGVPTYSVKIGTGVEFGGDIKQAIVDGFADLVETIEPPILKFVTNPLTGERSYRGKDMPIVSWDIISGADYIDVTCAPKALGGGRWAALEIFSYPTLDEIEGWIMDMVVRAGSQHCPPVTIGIGIGGSFDHAAKLAKQQTLRPFGTPNPEPILADMEKRLLEAVNSTGFGPMGTGGVTTALGVHIDYASGHGFTPVAIAFNCWINRRTRAKIYNSGEVERIE